MTTSGMLVEVQVLARGSAATAAVATGGTVVPVEDVTQFDDAGTVSIDGTNYDYTSVDETASTLTLASPLTADVSEFDPVLVVAGGQVVQDWTAVVDLGGEGDNVSVPIPYALRSVLGEGQYDPPVPVDVADDLSTVLDVPGRTPVIDGGMIDPTTLPSPSTPTEPPASSPTLTVTPLNTSLVVQATDVDPTTSIIYYISTTDGFTPDATTQVLVTRSTVVAIDQLADGTPLEQGTTYYIVAVASNVVGSAAPSAEVDAQLANVATTITADNVIGGKFTSAYDLTGSLQVGNIEITPGSGVPTDPDYDPGGLTIPLSSGGLIQFPADGSDATVQAHLDALSITIQDNLTLNGVHNDIAGTVALDNVPVAPKVAPTLALTTVKAGSGYQVSGNLGTTAARLSAGTLISTATTFVVFGLDTSSGTAKYPVWSINKSTGAVTTLVGNLAGNKTPAGATVYGLAYDGTNWYVAYDAGGATNIRVFNASWSQVADYNAGSSWNASLGVGTIAYDASTGNILIGGVPQSGGHAGSLTVTARNAATGAFVTEQYYTPATSGTGAEPQPVGLVAGACDFGGQKLVISRADWTNASLVYPAPTASNPTTADGTKTFRTTSSAIEGCCWDGTNFWYLIASAQNTYDIRKLANVPSAASRSVTWTQYCDASRTGSTGPHETKPSPAATISQAPRAWLQVTVPAPSDGGGPDDPNQSRIYIANHLQGALSGGGTATYGAPTTTGQAAPTLEGFASASGGSLGTLVSQAVGVDGKNAIQLKGDGSSKIGGASTVIAGTGGMQAGSLVGSINGTTASGTVTFPNAFAQPPVVVVSLETGITRRLAINVDSGTPPTATGFKYNLFATDGSSITASPTINWFAFGSA